MLICICSDCKQSFELTWDGKATQYLKASNIDIRSCDSGGVYACYIDCPYCNHSHELY